MASPSINIHNASTSKLNQQKRCLTMPTVMDAVKKRRTSFQCALCPSKVLNLNRHLKLLHNISAHHRVVTPAVAISRAKAGQKTRIWKRCPLCNQVVRRLDHHLESNKHQLTRLECRQYLKLNNTYSDKEPSTPECTSTSQESQQMTAIESQRLRPKTGMTREAKVAASVHASKQDSFKAYLMSFCGGQSTPCQAEKQSKKAMYLLNQIHMPLDNCVDELCQLMDQKDEKGIWAPNTSKTYLHSLSSYIHFVQAMQAVGQHGFKYNDIQLNILLKTIARRTKSLHRQSKKERNNTSPGEMAIPGDFLCYFETKRADEARHFLDTTKSYCENIHEHTAVRNFLLFQIIVANGSRTGSIINMTEDDFNAGDNNLRGGSHILHVKDHETASTYGSVDIILSPQLYKDLQTYHNYFRPRCQLPWLFITNKQTQMDSVTLANALARELAHAGIEKRLTATKLRHLAATMVSAVLPIADQNDLAELMAHSDSAQQQNYNECLKSTKNVLLLAFSRHGSGNLAHSETAIEKTLQTPLIAVPTMKVEPPSECLSLHTKLDPPHTVVTKVEASKPNTKMTIALDGARISSEEIEFLLKLFAAEILRGHITLGEIQQRRSEDSVNNYLKIKYTNLDEKMQCLRLRDILRNYSKAKDKIMMAKCFI